MFFSGLPYGRVWLCVLAEFLCLLTSWWDVIDILNMHQNCSKDKLFFANAVTGIMGTRQLPLFLTYVFSCLLSNKSFGDCTLDPSTTPRKLPVPLQTQPFGGQKSGDCLFLNTCPLHPPPPSLPNIITALFQHTAHKSIQFPDH